MLSSTAEDGEIKVRISVGSDSSDPLAPLFSLEITIIVDFYLPKSGNETHWETGSNETINTQLLSLKEECSSVNEDLTNLEMESNAKFPALNKELPSVKEDPDNLEIERNEATDTKFLVSKDEFTSLKEDNKYLKINTNGSHGNEIFGLDTFGINPNTYCKTIIDSNFQTIYIPTVLQNNSNKAQVCTNIFTKSSFHNNALRGSDIKNHEDGYTKPAKEDGHCLVVGGAYTKCKEINCSKPDRKGGFCKNHGGRYVALRNMGAIHFGGLTCDSPVELLKTGRSGLDPGREH
uniref:Uncharacterized protein n=1 Tax=Timema poppense TaxID=170557 RepID=A0A7R9H9Z0_TIMPO|nr:unnamed protein product [Timema poppensis]